jgi:thymidine kinase
MKLADQGIRVIAAGLDLDFTAKPFGCMPELLCLAEEVTKLHAVCMETGRPAHFSHRIAGGENTVEIGEKDRYIPLTRQAFVAARNEENKQ